MGRLRKPQTELPSRGELPAWLAPVPKRIEDLGFRFVWVVVAINLVGTAFGFWYYGPQLSRTPVEMWIFVPDSPMATLFIAAAFGLWAVGRPNEYLTALAFIGNIKLGLWTPWVLVIFADAFLEFTAPAMYAFLLVSHLAMVVQAFVLLRITDFPLKAVAVALAWYTVDLTVDYFIPVVGEPHHTAIPLTRDATVAAGATAFQLAAWGAVVLTLLPLFFALATRIKLLESAQLSDQ